MSIFATQSNKDSSQWMSVSDMMSVMMFIFMVIVVLYARTFEAEPAQKCDALFQELEQEFSDDFKKWNVTLNPDLTIRFQNPKVLFATQQSIVRHGFKSILNDFWPRYLNILENYGDDIKEVRIEGHTSKKWGNLRPNNAYFQNMQLSQERTRAILKYLFEIEHHRPKKQEWMKQHITANGLSSSKTIAINGQYSSSKSRRVEFRSISKACLKSGKQQ